MPQRLTSVKGYHDAVNSCHGNAVLICDTAWRNDGTVEEAGTRLDGVVDTAGNKGVELGGRLACLLHIREGVVAEEEEQPVP